MYILPLKKCFFLQNVPVNTQIPFLKNWLKSLHQNWKDLRIKPRKYETIRIF